MKNYRITPHQFGDKLQFVVEEYVDKRGIGLSRHATRAEAEEAIKKLTSGLLNSNDQLPNQD